MDNIETNFQPEPVPAKPIKRLFPSWLVYGVFGIVLLLILVIVLIPLPFSDYLYKFEMGGFGSGLSSYLSIFAGVIVLGYLTFYLIRINKKTSIRPIQVNSVPIVERLLFGPLTLWSAMSICAYILAKVIVRGEEGDSITAALSIAALFTSFPLAFLVHGLITFSLAQTRKRYAIMFFSSVVVIALMPVLLKVTAPLADAASTYQRSQDQAKTDQQLSQAHSMEDCANVGGDFGWVQCISSYMKSKDDYFECLKQAPTKDRPLDEGGLSLQLCDREYESYIRRFTGHATEPGPDGITYVAVPAEGTMAISDCADLQRYRAWSVCVAYAVNTKDDFNACLQQSYGRKSEFGDVGATACFKAFPKGFTSYRECTAGVQPNQQDVCLPLIMTTLSASSGVSWCYKLPTTDPTHQYNSQAATCLKELIKLQGNSFIKIVNICVYVSQQPSVESVNGAPCSNGLMDSYNAVKDITSVQDCFAKVKQTIEPQREICINRNVRSSSDYQTCLTLSDKEGTYSQRTSGSYCREAWPSGT